MENHHLSWENQLLMAIFNSYVKLPEGITNWLLIHLDPSSGDPQLALSELSDSKV